MLVPTPPNQTVRVAPHVSFRVPFRAIQRRLGTPERLAHHHGHRAAWALGGLSRWLAGHLSQAGRWASQIRKNCDCSKTNQERLRV